MYALFGTIITANIPGPMIEFIDAVIAHQFMRRALLAGLLASIACGIVGSYVVTRRITYIAGSMAHCILGGLGIARYLQTVHGWEGCDPLYGAVAAALLAAAVIGFVSLVAKEREDTVIGAVWAIGMAIGVLFISKTPGYNQDLMSYLFGNILMVSDHDLTLIALLDVAVVAIGLGFYKPLLAICFDDEFARLRGLRVEFYYFLLLCLTALTVVLLVTVVGLVMVIALLTLPAAVAGHFSRVLWKMMLLASVLSAAFTTLGIALSFGPDLPAGATIIIVAGIAYLAATLATSLVRSKHA